MALTRKDFTGDGTTTVYDISFDLGYLRKEDIYVSLDSNEYTNQLGYSFLNDTQIVLDAPVSSGVGFNIRRVVDRNTPINDYQEGAILREKNLDDSFAQALMIQQEMEDGYIRVGEKLILDSELDMGGKQIKNVGVPTDPNDAVRLVDAEQLAGQSSGGSTISEEPPTIKSAGDRWTRCSDMKAFLWYEDGDSGQWIEDRPSYGIDTIQKLSIPYVFDTVAEYKSFTTAFPVGKVIKLLDRGAEFTVIDGTGTDNDSFIITSDQTAQSITMTLRGWLSYESFGAKGDGVQQDAPFMALAHASGHRFIYGKPNSVYLHDGSPAYLESGTTVMLSNSTIKFEAGTYTDHMFIYKTNDDITYNAATPRKTNIHIYDGFVDGNAANITLTGKGSVALRAQNVDSITWHNPNIKNMAGDSGVYAAIGFFFSNNCDVLSPTIVNSDRQGIMFWESTGTVKGGSIGVSRVREPILVSSENVVAYQGAHAIIDGVSCDNTGTTSGTHVIRFSGKSSGVVQNCDLTGDNATIGTTDLDGVYITFAADHDVVIKNNDIRNCNKGLKVDSVGYKTISSIGNRYWSSIDAIEYNASGVNDHFTTSGDKLYDTVTQPLSIGFCDHVIIEDIYIRGGAQNNFISNFETLVIDGMKVKGMTSASNSVNIDGSGTPQAYPPQIDGLSLWGNTSNAVNIGENSFMINTNGTIAGNGIPLVREGDSYKWRDMTGDIRTSFSEPAKANRNTAGVVVGTQS